MLISMNIFAIHKPSAIDPKTIERSFLRNDFLSWALRNWNKLFFFYKIAQKEDIEYWVILDVDICVLST